MTFYVVFVSLRFTDQCDKGAFPGVGHQPGFKVEMLLIAEIKLTTQIAAQIESVIYIEGGC
jgi:hypothetical protein